MCCQDPCEFLEWDSKHFGLRIGRVSGGRLWPSLLAEIDRWAEERRLDCLYLLAEPEAETIQLAAAGGFRFVDVRTVLEISPVPKDLDCDSNIIRPFEPNDVAELRRIAGESHRNSRFYVDGRFPVAACDEMYRIWIARSAVEMQSSEEVLVAQHEGRVAGYVSCRFGGQAGAISLIAVDQHCRGRGIGKTLIRSALARFAARGSEAATVVTQLTNLSALRLYEAMGFRISGAHLWYHRWFLWRSPTQ